VNRYQKGKTNLDFTEARDSEWHWHQLGHMQVCTSLQTDDHTPPLSFFTGRTPFLPPNQQCQSTESKTGSTQRIALTSEEDRFSEPRPQATYTRNSATADGPRDALSVKILSTVETSCTTNSQQSSHRLQTLPLVLPSVELLSFSCRYIHRDIMCKHNSMNIQHAH